MATSITVRQLFRLSSFALGGGTIAAAVNSWLYYTEDNVEKPGSLVEMHFPSLLASLVAVSAANGSVYCPAVAPRVLYARVMPVAAVAGVTTSHLFWRMGLPKLLFAPPPSPPDPLTVARERLRLQRLLNDASSTSSPDSAPAPLAPSSVPPPLSSQNSARI
eukprot:gnl/Spiro4/27263_TR13562_c0_g1_i1.p1 gnl/Spiro4/27263_TR13562_c0_g1~~gnl/Spiro4/27263_TR13562_c0_g1_i1.p1  ORF type:complete len:162 (-),score=21.25 gnl/Spiro4/27263_TR13562_c0_g1_i1:25-510(-)